MTDLTQCRANNPATCRVHGTRDNSLTILLNPSIAKTNLNASKKAKREATTLEDMFEATQQLEHDQKVANSTKSGLQALERKIWTTTDFEDKMAYKKQLSEAEQYHAEVIQKLNATPVMQAANKIYADTTATAVQSFTLDSEKAMSAAIKSLQNVEPGTPIVLKTKDGSYLYDTASNGLIDGTKPGFLSKHLAPGFIQHFKHDRLENATVALKRMNIMTTFDNIQEIHVLPANAYNNGMRNFINPTNGKGLSAEETPDYNSHWAVAGKDYYYEFNGSGTQEEGSTRTLWTSLDHEFNGQPTAPNIIYRYNLTA